MDDLIIIGAGAAGLTASLFASRYKINHLLFGLEPGGQGNLAHLVENYPGYLSIKGPKLMQKFVTQVKNYGITIKQEQVGKLAQIEGGFEVKTDKGKYQAKTLILAMGASFRQLNIPGEEKFLGRGVSYCTVCDIPLFRDKVVAVVGGGDSAVTGAIHAASFAKKVYLIHRRKEFRAEPAWVEKLRKNPKIEEILSNEVKEILGASDKRLITEGTEKTEGTEQKGTEQEGTEKTEGTKRVGGVVLAKPYKESLVLPVDGVFIEIGQVPSSVLASQIGVELDEKGYVKITPAMETNIPGCFAAGDLAAMTGGALFRQFVTAAADGARAAASVYQYLHKSGPAPSWGK